MTKLTEEEIKKVSDLKIKFNQIVETTGAIEVQIMQLQAQKEELKVSLVDLRKEELEVDTIEHPTEFKIEIIETLKG